MGTTRPLQPPDQPPTRCVTCAQEKRDFLLGLMQGINPGPDKATTRKAVASNIFSYASELLTQPLTSTTMHIKGGG